MQIPEMGLSRLRALRAEKRIESWMRQQHQRRVLAGETTPSGPCPDEEFLQHLARRSRSISLADPRIDHAANCPKCLGRILAIQNKH